MQIQLKILAEEMQAVSKGLEKVVQELSASGNDGPVSETFCKVSYAFRSYIIFVFCKFVTAIEDIVVFGDLWCICLYQSTI